MDFKDKVIEKLKTQFPKINFEINDFRNELTIKFDKTEIVKICKYLKTDRELLFNLCEDVTAVDWAVRKNRFTIVYHLFSLVNKFRIRLKCDVDESDCSIDSVALIWAAANWSEREVYDMFGITFNNHPDLRRIYMPEDFEYYPLRKEFPLMGIPGSTPLPKK